MRQDSAAACEDQEAATLPTAARGRIWEYIPERSLRTNGKTGRNRKRRKNRRRDDFSLPSVRTEPGAAGAHEPVGDIVTGLEEIVRFVPRRYAGRIAALRKKHDRYGPAFVWMAVKELSKELTALDNRRPWHAGARANRRRKCRENHRRT